MLAELKIENVAVIQKAEVHFEPGLNVLTGETGAGKSIVIDSINAVLGERISRDLVRTGSRSARARSRSQGRARTGGSPQGERAHRRRASKLPDARHHSGCKGIRGSGGKERRYAGDSGSHEDGK